MSSRGSVIVVLVAVAVGVIVVAVVGIVVAAVVIDDSGNSLSSYWILNCAGC